ncbi:nucleotidyl transferase AbiEii/AbiGii toxin family protein [Acholeplasma palmae]|nr:nucleotidyl transferase AbiEii/AbiGii toxin family protein [Alteracholeplasma palmae]
MKKKIIKEVDSQIFNFLKFMTESFNEIWFKGSYFLHISQELFKRQPNDIDIVIMDKRFSLEKIRKKIVKQYTNAVFKSRETNPYIMYLNLNLEGFTYSIDISVVDYSERKYDVLKLKKSLSEKLEIKILTISKQLITKFLSIHASFRHKKIESFIKDFYDLKILFCLNMPLIEKVLDQNLKDAINETRKVGILMKKNPTHTDIYYNGFLDDTYWKKIEVEYAKYISSFNLDDITIDFLVIRTKFLELLNKVDLSKEI